MTIIKSITLTVFTFIIIGIFAYVSDADFYELAVLFLIGQGAAIVSELSVMNKKLNEPAPPTVYYQGDTVLSNGSGFTRKGLRGEVLSNDGSERMNNYVMFENGHAYYLSDSDLTLVKRNEARI